MKRFLTETKWRRKGVSGYSIRDSNLDKNIYSVALSTVVIEEVPVYPSSSKYSDKSPRLQSRPGESCDTTVCHLQVFLKQLSYLLILVSQVMLG